jgi:hypothetical protein
MKALRECYRCPWPHYGPVDDHCQVQEWEKSDAVETCDECAGNNGLHYCPECGRVNDD